MLAAKSTVLLAAFAVSIPLASAIPPACLLQAVKYVLSSLIAISVLIMVVVPKAVLLICRRFAGKTPLKSRMQLRMRVAKTPKLLWTRIGTPATKLAK